MTRRSLLGLLVAGASLLVGGILGIPALLAAFSPVFKRRPREIWRSLGRLSEFAIGAASEATSSPDPDVWPRTFSRQTVFVWRPSESHLVVFSRSCTDLGCALNYDRGSGCYLCPCHGGIFDHDGERLAGPPKKPMHRYNYRVRDGLLEIDLTSIPASA